METERGYVSTAVLDGDIYAVGGCNTLHQRLRSVERYNVKVNAWNPVPEMHFQRSDAAVAALNGIHFYLTLISPFTPHPLLYSRLNNSSSYRR